MTKFEQLDTMLEQGNGYITTRAVTAQGISKPYFAEYARSRELERVAHGVYQSRDAWPDDMYVLHLRNSNIIFSHQSALALHGMMEREPHHIYVTVKQGYNATHLRKQGVIVHATPATPARKTNTPMRFPTTLMILEITDKYMVKLVFPILRKRAAPAL